MNTNKYNNNTNIIYLNYLLKYVVRIFDMLSICSNLIINTTIEITPIPIIIIIAELTYQYSEITIITIVITKLPIYKNQK
jgi:hypothetical protein